MVSRDNSNDYHYCLGRGGFLRYSKQREALLQILRSTKTHPDAQWLYTQLKEEQPNISLGTVYRNLRQLTQMGDILELAYGDASHFDGDISPHYHVLCSRCNRIYDLPVEDVTVCVKSENDFKIEEVTLTLKGICSDCKNNF